MTVLRGNGNQAKGLVTANQVRDRMLEDIEDDEADEDEGDKDEEKKKFKSKRVDALIRGLERLGLQQLRLVGQALDRVPDDVKERFLRSRFRIEERIKVAKEASKRARGRFKIFDSEGDSDEEDNSGPGNSKNRGPGRIQGSDQSEADDSPGKSGNSGRDNNRGRGKPGRGGADSSDGGDEDEKDK